MRMVQFCGLIILYETYKRQQRACTKKKPEQKSIVDHHLRCYAELDRYVGGVAAAAVFGG